MVVLSEVFPPKEDKIHHARCVKNRGEQEEASITEQIHDLSRVPRSTPTASQNWKKGRSNNQNSFTKMSVERLAPPGSFNSYRPSQVSLKLLWRASRRLHPSCGQPADVGRCR